MFGFNIYDRVELGTDFDLALRLREFIVKYGTSDKQIHPLRMRLMAIEGKPSVPAASRDARRPAMETHSSFGEGV